VPEHVTSLLVIKIVKQGREFKVLFYCTYTEIKFVVNVHKNLTLRTNTRFNKKNKLVFFKIL